MLGFVCFGSNQSNPRGIWRPCSSKKTNFYKRNCIDKPIIALKAKQPVVDAAFAADRRSRGLTNVCEFLLCCKNQFRWSKKNQFRA